MLIAIIELFVSLVSILTSWILYVLHCKEKKFKEIRLEDIKELFKNKLYFFVASATNILFIFVANLYLQANWFYAIKMIFLMNVVQSIAFIDYKEQIIPNMILIVLLIIGIAFLIFEILLDTTSMLNTLLIVGMGILIICGILLITNLLFKGGIGMGDIKLIAVMCIFEGTYGAMNTIIIALLICFCFALYLLISKKKNKKDEISFGPFIYIGLIIASLLGLA